MLDEGPPKRERRKGGEEEKEREKGRGVTFEQCRQEVMTQFSIESVKTQGKSMEIEGGLKDGEGEWE